MPLSDREIRSAIAAGKVVIQPLDEQAIQPASVDLSLGRTLLVLSGDDPLDLRVDLASRYQRVEIPSEGLELLAGQFALGATVEEIDTGPYAGVVATRSSFARLGLDFSLSTFVNPGYRGTLPVPIVNSSGRTVRIFHGMRVIQLLFMRTGEVELMYDKRSDKKYFGESGPTPARQHLDVELRQALKARGLSDEQAATASELLERRVHESAAEIAEELLKKS